MADDKVFLATQPSSRQQQQVGAVRGIPMHRPLTADDIPKINEYWKGWDRLTEEAAPTFLKKANALLQKYKWGIAEIRQVKELAAARFATDYAFLVKNDHALYRRYIGEAVAPPRCSVVEYSKFVRENPSVDLACLPKDSPYSDLRFRRNVVMSAPPVRGSSST